jgi:hypothetical protein
MKNEKLRSRPNCHLAEKRKKRDPQDPPFSAFHFQFSTFPDIAAACRIE